MQREMRAANGLSHPKSSTRTAGRFVLRTAGNDIEIHLGSSTEQLNRPALLPTHPHQLQQLSQDGAQVTTDLNQRWNRNGVQPTAPGLETLLRPSKPEQQTTGRQDHRGAEVTQSLEEPRPPAFNPLLATPAAPLYRPTVGAEKLADQDSAPLSSTNGASVASPPPSYQEIYGNPRCGGNPSDQQQKVDCSIQTGSVSGTVSDECVVVSPSLRRVAQIGSYTDRRSPPQPGRFTLPTRISVRDDQSSNPGSPAILVTDPTQSCVHVFTASGDCLSRIGVPRVNGGCFVGSPPLLLLAEASAVSVYDLDGRRVKDIPVAGRQEGAEVLTAVPYGETGFVAVRRRSLSVCRGGVSRPAVVHTLAGRYRPERGPAQTTMTAFVNVIDVAVDRCRDNLVVLDAEDPKLSSHRTSIYVMKDTGAVLKVIRPSRDPECGPLTQPWGVAVDKVGGVMVSDGGRLVHFSGDNGAYLGTLISEASTAAVRSGKLAVRGIAARNSGTQQSIFAIITADNFAQLSVFTIQS